jgi:hypothetical protein
MCIITSVLCLSNGFVNDIRNLNNSRTHGNPYGIKGPEPKSLLFLVKDEMCRHLFLVSIVYFKINRMIVGFTSTYAINAYHH